VTAAALILAGELVDEVERGDLEVAAWRAAAGQIEAQLRNVGHLVSLERAGLEILSIEAVAEEVAGTRFTYAGIYSPRAWVEMDEHATEFGVEMLGVTSAEVLVRDRRSYDVLMADPSIYLLDMGIEQVRRASSEVDVVMNDLYWDLAGW